MRIYVRNIVTIATGRLRCAPRRVSLALLATLGVLALGSAPAWGVEGHVFSKSFAGEGEHALSKPKGVAIDQKTGQVYVVNSAEDDVEVFSASGGFEKVFGKKGTVKGDFEEPTEVAVDNSSVVSSTLMEGDVAVLDGKNKRVEIFNAEGTALKEITKTEINAVEGDGSKGGLKSIAGVAIDGSGDLWIWTSKSGEGGVVAMYELPAGGSLEFRYEDDSVVGEGLAVTLAGNILAGNGVAVSQTGPAGESFEGVGTFEGATGGVAGVAVDPDNGGVYLSRGVEVAHFPAPTSAGAGRSDSFGTLGAGELSAGSGVAVSAFTGYEHYVYVADSGANLVDVYTPVTLATASLKPAANVQETTAELSGEVNPEGMAVSACEFEYGTSEGQYTNTVPCSSLPGSGSSFVKVSASLTGLTVGIHYYARLSVTDANGTSYAQPLDAFETVHRLEIKTEGSGSVECEEVEHEHKRCEYEYGYPSGILLLLKANPDPGSSFVEWKEGSGRAAACDGPSEECEFRTGFEPVSITAVFTSSVKTYYSLKVGKTGTGKGTIVSKPAGIDCLPGEAECVHSFEEDVVVELEETPETGSEFVRWEGCESESGGKCIVEMSEAKTVKAVFEAEGAVVITTEPASGVEAELEAGHGTEAEHGTASATLHGKVRPNGLPVVSCEFEYGTSTSYGQNAPCVPAAGDIPTGGETAVAAKVARLSPDATYHFRLRAANANDAGSPAAGADQAFATPGPGITETFASKVTDESATLNASIDPDKASTSYHFEYDTREYAQDEGPHGVSVPVTDETIGSGEAPVGVSEGVQGLEPSTQYWYRVIAVSELDVHGTGTAVTFYGPQESFTTQRRGGNFVLPDDRAYEMVSPPEKEGAKIVEFGGLGADTEAAAAGGAMTYTATRPTESAAASYIEEVQALSTRTAAGWRTRDVGVPHGQSTAEVGDLGSEYRRFSSDLTHAIVQPAGLFTPCVTSEGAAQPCPSVAASEQTAFSYDPRTGIYTPLVTGCPEAGRPCPQAVEEHADVPSGTVFGGLQDTFPGNECGAEVIAFCGPFFIAATPDLSHVVLYSSVSLKSGSPGGLYEWSSASGKLTFVGAGEGEEIGPGEQFGGEGFFAAHGEHGISADGSRVVFKGSSEGKGGLLLRDTASEETVSLGEGEFQTASVDDSRVFFDTAWNGELEYDGELPTGQLDVWEQTSAPGEPLAGRVSDLTEGQGVRGLVLGASEDGSYVYFVSNGVLGEGAEEGAKPGTCHHPSHIHSDEFVGVCNLYVDHYDAETERWKPAFITALPATDQLDWDEQISWKNVGLRLAGGAGSQYSRVSPDGRYLTFGSGAPLTGYDNRGAGEVYLYHVAVGAQAGTLSCASCDPTGAPPASGASLPEWEMLPEYINVQGYQPRYLSDSGRLFFESGEALVPLDTDGTQDVYEYEPEGVGTCNSASSSSGSVVFKSAHAFTAEVVGAKETGEEGAGCVGLISSGNSSEASTFLDASENGEEVFFLTSAKLAPQDKDTAYDVYVARECTSASPCVSEPVAPPPCENEASCRPSPTPQPSIYGAPASATFNGPGNFAAPPATVTKSKPKPLTRAQKLAKALKACQAQHNRRKRAQCERAARKRYGTAGHKARAKRSSHDRRAGR